MQKLRFRWFGSAFALLGQVLIMFKSPVAFVAWSIGEGIFLVLAYKRKDYPECTFLMVYIVTNFIGLCLWLLNIHMPS